MKTKEELDALKKEVEALNLKLSELSEEEMKQFTAGAESENGYTVLACDRCGHEITWPGTGYAPWMHYAVDCEKCDSTTYHWVRTVRF